MQEDIERRTLAKALAAVLRKIQKGYRKAQTPQGRQSVKKLMNHRDTLKRYQQMIDAAPVPPKDRSNKAEERT
jgi:hypothetical protein